MMHGYVRTSWPDRLVPAILIPVLLRSGVHPSLATKTTATPHLLLGWSAMRRMDCMPNTIHDNLNHQEGMSACVRGEKGLEWGGVEQIELRAMRGWKEQGRGLLLAGSGVGSAGNGRRLSDGRDDALSKKKIDSKTGIVRVPLEAASPAMGGRVLRNRRQGVTRQGHAMWLEDASRSRAGRGDRIARRRPRRERLRGLSSKVRRNQVRGEGQV